MKEVLLRFSLNTRFKYSSREKEEEVERQLSFMIALFEVLKDRYYHE